ncbi:hypothetical protein KJ695_03005 [Patescibacteria group bacterium]|nr:hypothetical protein [Patescibacteria group bacterium]MBU4056853.1 hypothetical protein [Patescibacteria group bacterium]MBU4368137.1 hypothetical protein [Patescibacteria group bacterium]
MWLNFSTKKKNLIGNSIVVRRQPSYGKRSRMNYFSRQHFLIAKSLFLKLFAVVAVVLLIYLLIFSEFFRIKNVVVSGNHAISEEEVKKEILDFSRQKFLKIFPRNLIFIKIADMENVVKIRFGNTITGVEVVKNFPSTVSVGIKEKPRDISWCNKIKIERVGQSAKKAAQNEPAADVAQNAPPVSESAKCYFGDENNIIYEKSGAETNGSVAVFVDAPIAIGSKVADDRLKNFIRQIANDFNQKTGLPVVSLYIPSVASKEVHLLTDEGWKIYLDVNRDLDGQILVLNNVLKNGIPQPDRQKMDYIDLRVENRVYYKTK